jgi:hypothetical protein
LDLLEQLKTVLDSGNNFFNNCCMNRMQRLLLSF